MQFVKIHFFNLIFGSNKFLCICFENEWSNIIGIKSLTNLQWMQAENTLRKQLTTLEVLFLRQHQWINVSSSWKAPQYLDNQGKISSQLLLPRLK